jgi:hypothetical protein
MRLYYKGLKTLALIALFGINTTLATASKDEAGLPELRKQFAAAVLKGDDNKKIQEVDNITFDSMRALAKDPESVPDHISVRGGYTRTGLDGKQATIKFYFPGKDRTRPAEAGLAEYPNFPAHLLHGLLGVKSLDLINNYLEGLPPQLGSLISLEALYAGFNLSLYLPDEIGLPTNLKVLDVQAGQLFKFVEGYTYIEGQPPLYPLPETLVKLVNLKVLYLNRNKLGMVKEHLRPLIQILPKLQGLKELYLHDNLLFRTDRLYYQVPDMNKFLQEKLVLVLELLDALNAAHPKDQLTVTLFDFNDDMKVANAKGDKVSMSHILNPTLASDKKHQFCPERLFTTAQLKAKRTVIQTRWPNIQFASSWTLPSHDQVLRENTIIALEGYIQNIEKVSPELGQVARASLLE